MSLENYHRTSERSRRVRETLMHDLLAAFEGRPDELARVEELIGRKFNIKSFHDAAEFLMNWFARARAAELSVPVSNVYRRPTSAIFADWFVFFSPLTEKRIIEDLGVNPNEHDEVQLHSMVMTAVYKELSSECDPRSVL